MLGGGRTQKTPHIDNILKRLTTIPLNLVEVIPLNLYRLDRCVGIYLSLKRTIMTIFFVARTPPPPHPIMSIKIPHIGDHSFF